MVRKVRTCDVRARSYYFNPIAHTKKNGGITNHIHIRTQVRENKIPKKQWPPLLAIARRCTSFASKQGRIRALIRRFDALRALLRSNPQDALIDLYFAHEPELVPQMAKACSPNVSMPSSVQLSILNALEALVVWCDTGGGHFTMLAKRTWCGVREHISHSFFFFMLQLRHSNYKEYI